MENQLQEIITAEKWSHLDLFSVDAYNSFVITDYPGVEYQNK